VAMVAAPVSPCAASATPRIVHDLDVAERSTGLRLDGLRHVRKAMLRLPAWYGQRVTQPTARRAERCSSSAAAKMLSESADDYGDAPTASAKTAVNGMHESRARMPQS